jgi:uncharacterized glyoxalase superfamily protein PhnB
VKDAALLVGKVITVVVRHQVDNGPFGEGCRLVENEPPLRLSGMPGKGSGRSPGIERHAARRVIVTTASVEAIMSTVDRVIPTLTYQDIPAAHDFLVKAFGFHGGGVSRNAEGQPVHGEVRAGAATIWLHRVTPEHQLLSPLASDVATSGLFVYVDDVDAHYERARAGGAVIDAQPVDQPYGQREYGARDLEGHRWWFATPSAVQRQP